MWHKKLCSTCYNFCVAVVSQKEFKTWKAFLKFKIYMSRNRRNIIRSHLKNKTPQIF